MVLSTRTCTEGIFTPPIKPLRLLSMRLPQSSIPSTRLLSITIVLALTATLLCTQAAAQQLVFAPAQMRFGSVLVGRSETAVVLVTNAGSSSTTLASASVSGSEFTVSGVNMPVALQSGQSVALSITFSPTQAGYTSQGITFTDGSQNTSGQLPIHGVGVTSEPLTATPLSISFGQVSVGAKAVQSLVLTNNNSGAQTVRNFYTMSRGFNVTGPALPFTLGPGQSVTLSVTFAPKFAGPDGSSVFVVGPSVDVPITGTGTTGAAAGQLAVAPSSVNFNNVDVGSSSKQTVTMTATGGNVTVSSAASSNSQFSVPGATFPLTINAGNSVALDVVFAPSAAGASSAQLTFASNASNSPSSESVTGTGVLPQYTVNLSWSPSTSSVAGYNVYRGTAVGSYSKINASLEPGTAYADGTVASGTTYYYAATAVSANGDESPYSAPLKVVIP